MGRGIIGAEVGLGLDDSTGGAAASKLTQQDVPQKPTRDLGSRSRVERRRQCSAAHVPPVSPRFTFDQNYSPSPAPPVSTSGSRGGGRSEEHTSELQSLAYLVCRLLLEKKNTHTEFTVIVNLDRQNILLLLVGHCSSP